MAGKHVFFISDVDKFFLLFAESLISKLSVDPAAIVAVVYESGANNPEINRLSGVEYLDYNKSDIKQYLEAESLTFMSLLSWNSHIAEELILDDPNVLEKLFIFITDDEVSRWLSSYEENGCLMPDHKLKISQSCIFALDRIRLFICPKAYFRVTISKVLRRDDFYVYNASVVFDILPSSASRNLAQVFEKIDISEPRRVFER